MSKELIGSHSVHETLMRQTQIDAARIEELERDLLNLVCRIHRDGGHYIAKYGKAKAIADADTVAAQNNADLDALQADNARLRESLGDTLYFLERHSNRWDGINGKHPNEVACAARSSLSSTPDQSLAAYRNKAADRIEELEAINEKLTDWVEKRKEDLTAAYRTIDYLRAELERQKKAREGLTPTEALADYIKRNSKAMEERVERNNAVLKRLREDTE